MIRIIDTFSQIDMLFGPDGFDPEKWEAYIGSVSENAARMFRDDLQDCLDSGDLTYESDILPILNAVERHPALETLHASFLKVTDHLQEKVIACFGCTLEIDIVLYVGLCNAAGWVTALGGRDVILLGIEKILELGWWDEDAMYGLIYHELGHVYHKQCGKWEQENQDRAHAFVWQLFTEGIAMVFEQTLVQDFSYYHQDKDGWQAWCRAHFRQILSDFAADCPTMTRATQRYFGDWVSYHGRGDVGYYLGARFVQHLMKETRLDQLIMRDAARVYQDFLSFAERESAL
ncbi:MAG: hypothetical protein E7458_02780 [Ruminococcaceae bacterium]|nr:hypothetical protein [Oscillospiraceae bacterium]